jgi:hypothetical protein
MSVEYSRMMVVRERALRPRCNCRKGQSLNELIISAGVVEVRKAFVPKKTLV